MFPTAKSRLAGIGMAIALTALALTGCSASNQNGGDTGGEKATNSADQGTWPRTIDTAEGKVTIEKKPEKIVATSITLSGTLLAVNAPLYASAATTPGSGVDEQGFFAQWGKVAKERDVKVLYPNLDFDLESVIKTEPDLIVVSATGADSTADQVEKLKEIAQVVVLDYGSQSWKSLTEQVGLLTGHEQDAKDVVKKYDDRVTEAKGKIKITDNKVNAVVWNGDAKSMAFAKPGGPHAELLGDLGFEVQPVDDAFDVSKSKRKDFAFISVENAVKELDGYTVFAVTAGKEGADNLKASTVFRSAPAIAAGRVVPMGENSFRLDFYSAMEAVQSIEDSLQ